MAELSELYFILSVLKGFGSAFVSDTELKGYLNDKVKHETGRGNKLRFCHQSRLRRQGKKEQGKRFERSRMGENDHVKSLLKDKLLKTQSAKSQSMRRNKQIEDCMRMQRAQDTLGGDRVVD
ncbi:hypothetical protein OS493_038907 [Desmophyllum pertusum]|uniref:Uncharacterized protein n=1 Tax=Desmophyllum pertusum TaxID=174260 RepID=A0A9W9Y735_9CNID|nr:hypothetical protein OS493_038907 [Desmophyllum pertusum]